MLKLSDYLKKVLDFFATFSFIREKKEASKSIEKEDIIKDDKIEEQVESCKLENQEEPKHEENKVLENVHILSLADEAKFVNLSGEGRNIYWVRMNNEDIKAKPSPNHKTRPFLVMNSKENYFQGYYLTHNIKTIDFRGENIAKYKTILSDEKYNLKLPSVVLYKELITIDLNKVEKYIDKISKRDLEKIIMMRTLYEGKQLEVCGKNLAVGSVVEKDAQKYLIYQTDNSNAYAFLIKVQDSKVMLEHDFNYFADGDNLYRVFYDNPTSFSNDASITLCDVVNDSDVDKVLQKRKMYKNNKRKNNRLD